MNDITEIRTELVQALQGVDGLNAYPNWPNKLGLPAAVVVPDDPYVTNGKTFGTYQLNLTVLLITKATSNESTISEGLDSLIDAALDELNTDWNLGDVEAPSLINIDGVDYLGTSFTVREIYERTSTQE